MNETVAVDWVDKFIELEPLNNEGIDSTISLCAILDARRFDINNPPPIPSPILTIAGQSVATPGNLVAVLGQAKAGKSALLSAMLAALMSPTGDCLGVSGDNLIEGAVVHFDCEQAPHHHHGLIQRVLQRAGRDCPPPWLRSFRLADVATKVRRAAFAIELERAQKENGSVCAAILDGVGDICLGLNDDKEAFGLVEELHGLAIKYECVIICVLHENPSDMAQMRGKMRGHLGSQLERKAESNIRVEKDNKSEISTIFMEKGRTGHIPKEKGPRFFWSHETKMHISTETAAEAKAEAKKEKLQETAAKIFTAGKSLRHKEAVEEIMDMMELENRAARTRLTEMVASGLISKTPHDRYEAASGILGQKMASCPQGIMAPP